MKFSDADLYKESRKTIPDQVAVRRCVIGVVRISEDKVHGSAVSWISCDGPEVGDLEIGGTLDGCRGGECRASGQNNDSNDGLHFG